MAYLALDLGAGSGRAIVGWIEDGQIKLDEVFRFTNEPVMLGATLYWDFLSLFSNIKEGIRRAVRKGYKLEGIAVDTWGVDFGLIDQSGKLLSNPVCYRDQRTDGLSEMSENEMSKTEFYSYTGIQQMNINTVFQLMSLKQREDSTLDTAKQLLFTPDLINYFLTGRVANEYTIASTSQLLNANTKRWESNVFDKFSLPQSLMQGIIFPGQLLGQLTSELAAELEIGEVNIYAVGSHDTASAIGAIPLEGEEWAFLSSGTWSLLGVVLDKPILTELAMENNFTNEGGVDDKVLFMRNITGLWLLQRLILDWERRGDNPDSYTYEFLLAECERAEAFRCIVNTDDPSFVHPSSMEVAIQNYCNKTNQIPPKSKGDFVRCVLESLAVKNHFVMKKLKETTGKDIKQLYIVGGGSQNKVLNQYIADALNVEVLTGLTEATAIGNIMQQSIASEAVSDWKDAHRIIKNTFRTESYEPSNYAVWQELAVKVAHLF